AVADSVPFRADDMPCYKDLALSSLDSGVVRGSVLVRNRGERSTPDFRTWDPAHVVETAKSTELRNIEILQRAGERHLLRCGKTATRPMQLKCEVGMEESRWLRPIGLNSRAPSQMTIGRRGPIPIS
ncbi:unnamed protein product, partial [Polarella glacialis]